MEDRKEQMETKFKPILDIAANHKTELDNISARIEQEMPRHNEFMECIKSNEQFIKMKLVGFLMMEE